MQTQVGAWIRSSEQNDKLNILTSITHERYENQICKTNHKFFSLKHPQLKDWQVNYAEIPENYYIYNIEDGPWHESFDLAISHSCFGQFQFLYPLAEKMGIPLIRLEHTTCEMLQPKQIELSSRMIGDLNVFICEDQIKKWKMENHNCKVIKHCVDSYFSSTLPPSKRKKQILTIANDFVGRDVPLNFSLWKKLIYGLPFIVRGDTKGLSTACKNIEELRNEYRSSRVYINSSRFSPIPSSLLEAAACGCAIVTTKTCAIPEYFTHGVNCLMSNDETELRQYLELLLNDDKLADELGRNAQKMIKEKCSEERFIKEWNSVFSELRLK